MDFKEIKELIRVFDKSELNKLKVKDGEFEISMQTGFEGGTVVTTEPPSNPVCIEISKSPSFTFNLFNALLSNTLINSLISLKSIISLFLSFIKIFNILSQV